MLSIAAKVRTLKEELVNLIHLCDDLKGSLKNCSEEKFPEEIGGFARTMPEYKILVQERKLVLDLVRQVCTKECSIKEAIAFLDTVRAELVNTRKLINL